MFICVCKYEYVTCVLLVIINNTALKREIFFIIIIYFNESSLVYLYEIYNVISIKFSIYFAFVFSIYAFIADKYFISDS